MQAASAVRRSVPLDEEFAEVCRELRMSLSVLAGLELLDGADLGRDERHQLLARVRQRLDGLSMSTGDELRPLVQFLGPRKRP
jgi:hypothetical protein